ncbi:uncharacterized protein LOC143869763 [Tasmannia lanceolata]|uniref:uncharacterized protein LOC143869763 n=1 Tax=Tasmannia lanceolata TaxID=3420 RepID=UPI0040646A6D
METSSSQIVEGQSTSTPPFFNGTNYGHWKAKMKIYLKGQEFGVWRSIEKGYEEPFTNSDAWSLQEKANFTMNYKAMNALICALSSDEFNRVSNLKSAREIWETLEVTYEGTTQVEKTKVNLLVSDFEAFKMKDDESISEMYTRFSNIINELECLGKLYYNEEMVNKLLKSLPVVWDPKIHRKIKGPRHDQIGRACGLTHYP